MFIYNRYTIYIRIYTIDMCIYIYIYMYIYNRYDDNEMMMMIIYSLHSYFRMCDIA